MASHFRPSPGKKSEAKRNHSTTPRNTTMLESVSNEDRFAAQRERNLAARKERSRAAGDANIEYKYDAWFGTYGTKFPQESAASDFAVQSRVVVGSTDERIRVDHTTEYPWRAICHLSIKGIKHGYLGTAWFLTPRLLITAGHCVYIHDDGGWAQQIVVCPGRNGTEKPYGTFAAKKFRSVQSWIDNPDNDAYDLGGILLPADHPFRDLALGNFGCDILDDQTLMGTEVFVGGYPGQDDEAPQFNKVPEDMLWYDKGHCFGVTPTNLKYPMDTQGGESGAPVAFKGDSGATVVGIHTAGSRKFQSNYAVRVTAPVIALFKQWAQEAGA